MVTVHYNLCMQDLEVLNIVKVYLLFRLFISIQGLMEISYCKSCKEVRTPVTIFPIFFQIVDGVNARRDNLFLTLHIKSFVKITNWSRFVVIMSLSYIRRSERVTTAIHNFTFSLSTDLQTKIQLITNNLFYEHINSMAQLPRDECTYSYAN